jgi:hypothetical protein
MQSLDKNFRHLSRQQKLQQLVDKQWLSEEQCNNPTGNAPCAMTFSIKLFATSSSING